MAVETDPHPSSKELLSGAPQLEITLTDDGLQEEVMRAMDRGLGDLQSLPPPPFDPEATRYLAEVGGLLFSLSCGPAPWTLPGDALVVPVGATLQPKRMALGMLAEMGRKSFPRDALAAAIPDGVIEAGVAVDLGEIRPPGTEGKKDETQSGATRYPRIILATSRDRKDQASPARAISSSLAAIETAEGIENCRTLILPTISCGLGGLDSAEVVRGIIEGLDPARRFETLRHVVIAEGSQDNRDKIHSALPEKVATPDAALCQKLKNDLAEGEDELDVKAQVRALADAIALKDMKPPLVVGVLGGWGTGKSFVLHLLKERLKWVRGLDLPGDPEEMKKFPYVGHPYLVHFDAWTYAKSDLWASLMQKILRDLDAQLGLEQMLDDAGVDLRTGTDIWKLMGRLSPSEREAFDGSLGKDAMLKFVHAQKDSSDPEALWEVLRGLRHEERTLLGAAEKELGEAKEDLDRDLAAKEEERDLDRLCIEADRDLKLRKARSGNRRMITGRERALNDALAKLASDRNEDEWRCRQRLLDDLEHAETASRTELAGLKARCGPLEHEAREFIRNEMMKESRARAWSPIKGRIRGVLGKALDKALEKITASAGGKPVTCEAVQEEIGALKRVWGGFDHVGVVILIFAALAVALPLALDALDEVQIPAMVATIGGVLSAVVRASKISTGKLEEQRAAYDQAVAKEEAAASSNFEARVEQKVRDDDEKDDKKGVAALRRSLSEAADSGEEEKKRIQAEASAKLASSASRFESRLAVAKHEAQQDFFGLKEDARLAKEDIHTTAEEATGDLIERIDGDLDALRRERTGPINELEDQVAEHRRRVGITARSPSLLAFVRRRIGEEIYDKRLGILHQVQQDLEEVTDALIPESLEERQGEAAEMGASGRKRFPRGDPRIVLFVDDLDRCPPKSVVEMLEVAQLLVKTRLFVVVLAMDVRYVTRSLEDAYHGILVRDGDPSGLDYIEKIVQIPYRVPAIDPDVMGGFLASQMEFKAEKTSPDLDVADDKDSAEGHDTAAKDEAAGSVVGGSPASVFFRVPPPDVKADEPIPMAALLFTEMEHERLDKCCRTVGVTPRAATRLVNVYKLLKIIWHRTCDGDSPNERCQKAMILLLTLAARFPEVMRKLLHDLDRRTRMDETEPRGPKNLKRFLLTGLKDEDLRRAYWEDRKEVARHIGNTDLLSGTLPIDELESANIRLVHSFCFAGEVTHDPEENAEPGPARPTEPNRDGRNE
jgi:KAP family P-loop domain